MSMSKSEPFTITAIITLDDEQKPQAVTVENFGGIPRSAVRSIAEEALDSHFGSYDHPYRVQLTPEETTEEFMVFEVYERLSSVWQKKISE